MILKINEKQHTNPLSCRKKYQDFRFHVCLPVSVFEEEKTLNKHNNSNYPYVSKSKSDSVETKGKSSLFHCDECEYSCEEKNN